MSVVNIIDFMVLESKKKTEITELVFGRLAEFDYLWVDAQSVRCQEVTKSNSYWLCVPDIHDAVANRHQVSRQGVVVVEQDPLLFRYKIERRHRRKR